jgi:hypothetical protein
MSENTSPAQRKKYQRYIIASECCGSIPGTMLTESAVIIFFITQLGLGESFSVMTSSFRFLISGLLTIPCAYFAMYLGCRQAVKLSSLTGTIAFILLALSPFAGPYKGICAMTCCILYSVTLTIYSPAIWPLIDSTLEKGERIGFIGRNRFTWMSCSSAFILLCGFLTDKDTPLWQLQLAIGAAAVIAFGRYIFIGKIPDVGRAPAGDLSFRKALKTAASNLPLCGFALYLFFLYLGAYALIPVGYIYLKRVLLVPANEVIIISGLAMGGTMTSYFLIGKIVKLLPPGKIIPLVHVILLFNACTLFFLPSAWKCTPYIIGALLVITSMIISISSAVTAGEILALARPDNKLMAVAFGNTIYQIGMGGGRFMASLLLGCGALCTSWTMWGLKLTDCQSLFLVSMIILFLALPLLLLVPSLIKERDYYYENTK